jgi:hypothetical protein
MVMDYLPAHNCEDACELTEGRSCELLLVPTFARLSSERGGVLEDKALLRKAKERTQEALIEALGAAISAVTPQDVRGFFELWLPRQGSRML